MCFRKRTYARRKLELISTTLYDYQSREKLFYLSTFTFPNTDGLMASFGMSHIIIAEPHAYVEFAGKRVIIQALNKTMES